MASSHGFGSAAPDENAPFGLAFAPAPARLCLNHAGRTHSPVHSSIGTPSGSGSPHAALGLLVRTRFQDLFHSPRRGAFHHSLTVLVRYRSLRVLCLGGWSPLLPTAFHGRRRTRDPRPRHAPGFAYGALTPSGRAFQSRSTRQIRRRGAPAKAPGGSHNPRAASAAAHMHGAGFGLVPVRSPLLGESFSAPRGTKMFQFPRFPPAPYRFRPGCRRITAGGLPHSGILGSPRAQPLPEAFRSSPRPSSARNAKASPTYV